MANDCFAKQLLEQKAAGKLDISDLEVAWACGTPFGAGVETTSGTLLCFLLACAEFGPSFIPQAQAELDSVVGSDRLPTFEDEEDLPFVRAVVKETLRWRPIAVLGVSWPVTGSARGMTGGSVADTEWHAGHAARCHRGGHLHGLPHSEGLDHHRPALGHPPQPQGRESLLLATSPHITSKARILTVSANDWQFPNPHTFDPTRFLPSSPYAAHTPPYPGARGHTAFGWGRRICPGQFLAEQSIFINIAKILWAFNVSKARDAETGAEVPVDLFAFTDGFNSLPLPFRCAIKVRSEAHARVVEREWEDAQEGLRANE